MDELSIDEYGFVYISGLKICRIASGYIEFFDRNKRRSEKRGSSFVYVTSIQLYSFLRRMEEANGNQKSNYGS